jgi:hypothetical protein
MMPLSCRRTEAMTLTACKSPAVNIGGDTLNMFPPFGHNDHPDIRCFLNDPQDGISP